MDNLAKKRCLNRDVESSQINSCEGHSESYVGVQENDLLECAESNNVDGGTFNSLSIVVEEHTRIIQEAYILSSTLNEFTRSELIENITECYLHDEVLLPASKICAIAKEICSTFPNEDMSHYYIDPSGKATAPGGRLYNRYTAKLKKMRESGQFPMSTRAVNKIRKLREEEIYVLSEEEKESIEYLRREEFTDFHEVVKHWRLTCAYRQNVFGELEKDTKMILRDEWKLLSISMGHVLVCEDFRSLYGFEKATSLRSQWKTVFDEAKFDLLTDNVKNKATLRKVERLPLTNEYVDVSTILLINAILIPPLGKQLKRPTIEDAQNSVIMIAKNYEELQKCLEDRFEGEFATKTHPIIIAMDTNSEEIFFYLIFHNLKYRFNKLTDALDVCFKMFCVFQVDFPHQCTQFYSLLNELFYKIDLKIAKSAKVADLIKYLKK